MNLIRWNQMARDLGFHLYGWTHAGPFDEMGPRLEERFAQGRNAPGEWSDHRVRIDPARLLEGARSLWVVAMSYLTSPPAAPSRSRPQMARFTWGRDYHRVLGERLKEMVDRWSSVHGAFQHRICVDTSPLPDRAAARRAHLGWTGKNACLINPQLGSWLVLGAVITDLDPPEATSSSSGILRPPIRGFDPCSGCNRCLKACPVGALSPYRLDASRCLSHISQSPEDPPPGSEPHLARCLWGCDLCQEVCPWNAGVIPREVPEFRPPRRERVHPPPGLLAQMDEGAFTELFGDSALAWRGAGVLRRNARLALRHLSASD